MELLTPVHLPLPIFDRYPRLTLQMPSYGTELAESSTSCCSARTLMNIAEEREEENRREKIYVAVGKRREKAVQLIQWTLRIFRSSNIVLIHVHQPSLIPTILGKLPASKANVDVVASYRKEEKKRMTKLLHSYLNICYRAKVKASFIFTEAKQVHKGLVELVINHDIQQLVMGSVTGNCMKVTKNSSKANFAAKNAPAFCEIRFIYKGKLVWTREAFEEAIFFPSEEKLGPERLRSVSFRDRKTERSYNPDNLHFSSSQLSTHCSVVRDLIKNEDTEEYLLLPRTSCSFASSYCPCYSQSSTSNESVSTKHKEIRVSTDSYPKLEEETLFAQLLEVKEEVDKSRKEALAELLKREKLEAEAVLAMKKVNDITSFHSHEVGLKKEAEDALRSVMHEQERLMEEGLELTGEFQKTMRNVAVLDIV